MARQSLLSVVLGLMADKFEAGLTRAQRKLSRTANDLSQIGRGLSLGVTAPLAAIGVSSFKVAADFELAMKKVKAVSGATGAEFDKLEKNALDLGKSTVISASSIADGGDGQIGLSRRDCQGHGFNVGIGASGMTLGRQRKPLSRPSTNSGFRQMKREGSPMLWHSFGQVLWTSKSLRDQWAMLRPSQGIWFQP